MFAISTHWAEYVRRNEPVGLGSSDSSRLTCKSEEYYCLNIISSSRASLISLMLS